MQTETEKTELAKVELHQYGQNMIKEGKLVDEGSVQSKSDVSFNFNSQRNIQTFSLREERSYSPSP